MDISWREELLAESIAYIKDCRKQLHQIPELANEEFKTQAFIIGELEKMGISYEVHDTAVIGILKANADYQGADGPFAIAFRSDMDALPVCEQSGNAFPSTHEGKMHACGHDGHMSMLLGTVKILSRADLKRSCDFIFVFQPAEESVGGAKPLIKTGFIERLGVREIFGIHLHPNVEEGRLASASGAFMARGTDFNVTVRGVSAHAAMPHLGIDALLASAHFLTNVQQIVSRNTDPTDTAVFTIGSIQAGERRNIIAKEAHMEGIFRTFSEEQAYYVERRMREIASAMEQAHGVTFEFWVDHKYPAVINDARLAEEFFALNENADRIKPQMISEDFSFYQLEIPGLFFYVGTRNEERGFVHPLHSAQFDFVPDALIGGPRAYLNLLMTRGYIERA
ncbi:MAG: M20 family metallopeptidase [Bacillota bacterium]|nr:M20 family metallopeptidase [Bacillota bacterium]